MKTQSIILLFLTILGASGCASQATVRDLPKNDGEFHVFNEMPETVLPFVKPAVQECGLTVNSCEKIDNGWRLLASGGGGLTSYGAVARILVEPRGADKTTIRFSARARGSLNSSFTKLDYHSCIFSTIDEQLSKSSKP